MSPQQPFNGAASSQAKKNNDLMFFYFLFSTLFNPSTADTQPEFEQAKTDWFGDTPLGEDLTKRLDEFFAFLSTPTHPDRQLTREQFTDKYTQGLDLTPQATRLNADLLNRLGNRPLPTQLGADPSKWSLGEKVLFAQQVAKERGLDANLFVNQLWQESRFNNTATGPATRYGVARGIGQFIPETGRQYGLNTVADFNDPVKSITASANYMRDLKNQFGDQRIALVAYNAGPGTAKSFGSGASIGTMIAHWEDQNRTLGTTADMSRARRQTLEYVKAIDSNFWTPSQIARADHALSKTGFATAAAAEEVIRREGLSGEFANKDRPKATTTPILLADASQKTGIPEYRN